MKEIATPFSICIWYSPFSSDAIFLLLFKIHYWWCCGATQLWIPTCHWCSCPCPHLLADALFAKSILDLFPKNTKRKRGLGQSVKPRKRCKYSHSADDQNPTPVSTSLKVKHRKITRPRQGWQPRNSPGFREQQQDTRQQGRARSAKRKPAKGPRQHHTKLRRGSRPQGTQRQGKPGLLRKQLPKGKGAFRKQRHPGRKGPV